MKKSLLALAVLGAFAASAHAQSSVTVYGSFDGGVRYVNNVNAAGDDRTSVSSNGTFNSNRLGFRGVEDLGGGLNARFTLESGFNTGTGAFDNAANNIFNRTAAVGIGGAWGGIDLGRQYSVSFKTIGAYDPFNYKYTGIIPLAAAAAGSGATSIGGTRFNNDIQYTGTFGPATIRAEYALGETTGSNSNGSAVAVGGTFATGPFSVGGAYTQKKPNVGTAAAPNFQDNNQWTIGGAYKIAALRVAGGYIREKQEFAAAADTTVKNGWIGASYNFTPAFELSGAWYQTKTNVAVLGDGKRDLFIFGAIYSLSKRTNIYADIDYARLSGTSRLINPATGASQDRQTGFSVGLNHLF
ncbi:porin [Noviherbaspirillum cavernae]|uniref:Porin n=1 Tax=Noviherbaspirillum cavernae TaxID=2320862 RepID=A0A418X3Y3_9BURK|nr:porin [Noviherbaspirillum cavernae]RJG07177.1 porin [Noviherbaspirillum cavernae]